MNSDDLINQSAELIDSDTKVLVVVVTYNAAQYIRRCLSCLESTTEKVQVVVIDNQSTDNTTEIVAEFSQVVLIKLQKNLGFGRANNIGLEVFLQSQVPYVFLCNQDVYVTPQTLSDLVRIHEASPEHHVLGPVQLSGDGKRIDVKFAQYIRMFLDGDLSSECATSTLPKQPVLDVDFINAAAWLMTRECINTVGGFDPIFFLYGEDDDYIDRMRFHGLKVGLTPGVHVIHDRPQTKEILNKNNRQLAERFHIRDKLLLKNLEWQFWRRFCRWLIKRPLVYFRFLASKANLFIPLIVGNIKTICCIPKIVQSRKRTIVPGHTFLRSESKE